MSADNNCECSLYEATRIIEDAIASPTNELMSTRAKIRKRIVYAIRHKQLSAIRAGDTWRIKVEDLKKWANSKWPKIRMFDVEDSVSSDSTVLLTDQVNLFVLPGDLKECQQSLRLAQDHLIRLAEDLLAARLEATKLRPMAKKYEEIREKNKRSAKKRKT